jgi:hypothetical protein
VAMRTCVAMTANPGSLAPKAQGISRGACMGTTRLPHGHNEAATTRDGNQRSVRASASDPIARLREAAAGSAPKRRSRSINRVLTASGVETYSHSPQGVGTYSHTPQGVETYSHTPQEVETYSHSSQGRDALTYPSGVETVGLAGALVQRG